MAAPCFESQTREKLKLPKDVMDAFTDKMLEHIQNGRSYPEALDAMSEATGLQRETINRMYQRDPRSMSLTKQAIARAGRVRSLRDAADATAGNLKINGTMYSEPGALAKAWDVQRRIALTGHSPIFPWSHMRDWAVQLPTQAGRERMAVFWRAAGDVYRYGPRIPKISDIRESGLINAAMEKGRALHEMDISLMQKGDRYDFFRKSSLDITPGKMGPGDILLQGRKPSWTRDNFDALKVARYKAADNIWAQIDPALKEGDTGAAVGAMLMRDLNYATGSIMPPVGEAANVMAKSGAQLSQLAGHYNLLMSSKLFFAKYMNAVFTPLRYLFKAGRMIAPERAAANVALGRWANTVTAHLGVLGINWAFNKAMGWKTPNLTDPTKSDYLRLRLGNYVVPFSPMLEAIRLPIVVTYASLGKGEGGQKAWEAVWNAAHPAFHTLYEQVTGKDFLGRPIPTATARGLLAKKFPALAVRSGKTPVGIAEYVSTRSTPIAVSGALREYYQALRDQGLNASMSLAILKGLGAGAASGLAGMHVYEPTEPVPRIKAPHRGKTAVASP